MTLRHCDKPIVVPLFTSMKKPRINLDEVCSKEWLGEINHIAITPRPPFTPEQEGKLDINPSLTPEQKVRLLDMLGTHSKAFAWNTSEVGKCNIIKFKIDTGDSPPIAEKFYRKSIEETRIIREQVHELLRAGIIRPSTSAWCANPLVVTKKTKPGEPKEYRMVISYKKLNAVTKVEQYPMTDIDTILHSLNDCDTFTKMDLRSGYFQIEIEEEDKCETAFICSEGLFEFNYMAFGTINAPACFNRMMGRILNDLVAQKKVAFYMDDLVVTSKGFEKNLEYTREVVQRLMKHGLTLHPNKCSWCMDSITILGHVVDKFGVHCDPQKLAAVKELPPPQNLKELRSLLGMCSYYRSFIPDFASITRPLTSLLRKDEKYHWGTDQQSSFDKLKQAMASPPILTHYDENLPIQLLSDASTKGIGGALMQTHNGRRKPICYASRTLSPAESKYSVSELECLAIIWLVGKFRHYLFERPFTIITDHCSICALKMAKNLTNARLLRWQVKLQSMKYTIEYTKGASHHLADCLSRMAVKPPTESDEEDEIPLYTVAANDGLTDLAQKQASDPHLSKLLLKYKDVHDGIGYKVLHGILYYQNTTDTYPRICVPSVMINELIRELHEAPLMAHVGGFKTYERIKCRYFFPNLRKKIDEFIRSCHVCQMRRPPPEGYFGQTKNLTTEDLEVWDLVSIDICGPFPQSTRGNKYIIQAVEHKTRWVIAKAYREATAKTVARFVYEHIICVFGSPKRLLSDNGTQFTSNFYKELNNYLGTKVIYSTPYHSEGNALCERQFKTIQQILSKFVSYNQKDWCKFLPSSIFAINTTTQKSLKYSSYYLLFLREPRIPFDVYHDRLTPVTSVPELVAKMKTVHAEASSNLTEALKTQKVVRDKKFKNLEFDLGDKVMVYTSVGRPDTARKLTLKWYGPYEVTGKMSSLNYTVFPLFPCRGHTKEIRCHIKRMKRYYPPRFDSEMLSESERGGGESDVADPAHSDDESETDSERSLDSGSDYDNSPSFSRNKQIVKNPLDIDLELKAHNEDNLGDMEYKTRSGRNVRKPVGFGTTD